MNVRIYLSDYTTPCLFTSDLFQQDFGHLL
jgi:hypothetical protein